ncbi:aminodeoxychorismate synthase component I [Pelagibius marinus]|uniref:aminodeoxychorismate synthase component I n=1 Tax=Pelagibius marinus TaxID=2762760 RepID=UPI001872239F|nr:aminodeoxychorismate synthase component I [Pelagibius marinus]
MPQRFVLFDAGPTGRPALFAEPRRLIVAWSAEEVPAALAALRQARDNGLWLAGACSYELGYLLEPKLAPLLPQGRRLPLICFGVFDGPDEEAAQKLLAAARRDEAAARLSAPRPDWSETDYLAAFDRVEAYIAAGDIYQANLTFPMSARYEGPPLGLYAALSRLQPVRHGAVVALGEGPLLLSRSPELFFRVDAEGVIETRPMKGTTPRGASPEEDRALADFLRSDPKNRAENLMIVDLLRNDIGRVARIGSVEVPELFTVEDYATVHQMTSLVRARLRDGIGLPELLYALFPCGSVTGAPKVRAMEILRELEPQARDAYCGAIGWAGPDGSAAFNVAIRTLSIFDDGAVTLNVGGGVVYDSTGPAEYEEALWKARYTNLPRPA